MQQKIIKNKATAFLVTYYLFIIFWWIVLFSLGSINTLNNYLFAFLFSFIPFMGSIFGIINSRHWGFLKSAIGKSTFFISLGLLTWSIGQIIFSYYNLFLNVAIPYPSLADASFILSWPLWGIGIFFLSKATGAKYGLKLSSGKYLLLFIPLLVIIFSYYLLVVVARGGQFDFTDSSILKIFFDLFYPVTDVIILTLSTVIYGLSYNYLGGKYKIAIYIILFGFVINYFADFFFSYTTTLGTFFSGNWVDLLFSTALFLLSYGVAGLDPRLLSKKL